MYIYMQLESRKTHFLEGSKRKQLVDKYHGSFAIVVTSTHADVSHGDLHHLRINPYKHEGT